jgi:hypothetical protein
MRRPGCGSQRKLTFCGPESAHSGNNQWKTWGAALNKCWSSCVQQTGSLLAAVQQDSSEQPWVNQHKKSYGYLQMTIYQIQRQLRPSYPQLVSMISPGCADVKVGVRPSFPQPQQDGQGPIWCPTFWGFVLISSTIWE